MELGILRKGFANVFVLVLVLTSFSGCVELLGEPGGGSQDAVIAKKVVWSVTEDTWDEEEPRFEDLVKTRLEYTHRGGAVPASALMFSYTSERGAHRENPATQFTTNPEVRDGDVIVISPVNITSGLVAKRGDDVFAKRGNLDDDWFRAGGVPIPLFSNKEGLAQYEIDSSAGFHFNATGIAAEGTMVDHAFARVEGQVTGPLAIKTIPSAQGPRIELSADLDMDLEALLEAAGTEDGEYHEIGMEITDFVGELEGLGTLQFSPRGELTKTGDSGRLFMDANVHVWDEEHPRSMNYEPEDVEHPIANFSEAYSEEPVPEAEDVEAWVVDFLTKVWSMEVAVGDDYRFHFEHDGEEAEVEFDYIIQIVAEEAREVGGKSMPAYRVSQLANLVVDFPNGVDATFDVVRGTYWVSKDSYLPIYAQVSSSRSFNRADAEQFLTALGEEVPYELPETFVLLLSGEQILKLTSYSGDATIAPIVGVLLGNSGSYGLFGAPSMFLLMSGVAAAGDSYEPPVPPDLDANPDELADRLTIVRASAEADWSKLVVRLTSFSQDAVWVTPTIGGEMRPDSEVEFYGYEPLVYARTPVIAGDTLQFCSDGLLPEPVTVDILHTDSYETLYEHTFSDLATCT